MIRGVVFDLDHTLYDRYGTIELGAEAMYKYGAKKSVSREEIAREWIRCDKELIHLGPRVMYGELGKSHIFEKEQTAEHLLDAHVELFSAVAKPFDFTIPTLTELRARGFKLGLITNGSGTLQRRKLALLGLENAFDHILIGGEFGLHKPHTEMYDEMSRLLDIAPSELMYVGDNPINDVDASRKAGYVPVWVRTTSWHFPDIEQPALQVDKVSELLEFDELK